MAFAENEKPKVLSQASERPLLLEQEKRGVGFRGRGALKGLYPPVPKNIDGPFREEIEAMFYGEEAKMETVNMHEAKTHLSRLVDKAAKGEPFVIARAGKPLVKVVAIEQEKPLEMFGWLRGQGTIPEDFDRFGEDEIAELFGTKP